MIGFIILNMLRCAVLLDVLRYAITVYICLLMCLMYCLSFDTFEFLHK